MERINLPDESEKLGTFRVANVIYFFTFLVFLFQVGLLIVVLKYGQEAVNYALEYVGRVGLQNYARSAPNFFANLFQYGYYILCVILGWYVIRCFYDFFVLRNTILFIDEQGIWLHRGVFSWQKEINGVYWADASMAKSRNSFFGLFFNAYPVIVLNRYTGNVEINVRNMKDGKKAITLINERVEKFYNQR